MITFLYIALLAIMMVLVMVETSSVIRLRREVKWMEQQQIKRLNTPQTNTISGTVPSSHLPNHGKSSTIVWKWRGNYISLSPGVWAGVWGKETSLRPSAS